tara:strand:+ start:26 stop:820 length:795 start_codon:yes stop_codon:yes gene_type:complete
MSFGYQVLGFGTIGGGYNGPDATEMLFVGAGGQAGKNGGAGGSGGGGGGNVTTFSDFVPEKGTAYTVTIGVGGDTTSNLYNTTGRSIGFTKIVAGGGIGGQSGGQPGGVGSAGGGGGGYSSDTNVYAGGAGTAYEDGTARGNGGYGIVTRGGSGGGASGAQGGNQANNPGSGVTNSFTGSSVEYGKGGGNAGGAGGANTGAGGGGTAPGGGALGGTGLLAIKYAVDFDLPTISAGLTASISSDSAVSGKHLIKFTAGTGTVTWE